ncbi:MAG: prmA [Firmicutes bacterium]|nr:prmA [Bacillota bacterium]
MKWAELSIQTVREATEAVANIFHELGSSGVVIEDPELINLYRQSGTWEYCDIPEQAETEVVTVKAYLPVDDCLDEKIRLLSQCLEELEHNIEKRVGLVERREVQEEDWAVAWKEFFVPVKVGERIVIKPTWKDYNAREDEIVIEIDPGMAFGTGSHHTTAMCIRLLEDIVANGNIVYDVGTGSGILSVAAAKLGATQVRAVDIDSVAVRVAAENIAVNQVENVVEVAKGDLLSGFTGQADVIVANIIADVIINMLPDVPAGLVTGGYFVASGIIAERVGEVLLALSANGLTLEKATEEGGWGAVLARKGGN